jgi:hypothetical protein
MIGLYIVDGILIAGIIYLCCTPYKKYNFEKPDEDKDKEFNNYLSFNDSEKEIRALV